MNGLDLSRWNEVSDYNAAASGMDFLVLKMGGSNTGSTYVDSKYRQHVNGFAGKLAIGSYWMNGAGPPTNDANYFVANVDPRARDFIALDIETIDGYTAYNPGQAAEWFNVVRAAFPGAALYAYMNSNHTTLHDWSGLARTGVKLWVANFNDRRSEPSTGSWPGYAIHQYTESGYRPGVVGGVDLNYAREHPGKNSGGFLDMLSKEQVTELDNINKAEWEWGRQIHPWMYEIVSGVNALKSRPAGGVSTTDLVKALSPMLADILKEAAPTAQDMADRLTDRLNPAAPTT